MVWSHSYLVIGNRIMGWESLVDHPVGQPKEQDKPSEPIHRRIQLNEAALAEAEASPETRFRQLDPLTSCLRSAHLPPDLPKDDGMHDPS